MKRIAVLLVFLAGCANHASPRTSPKNGAKGVTEISVRAHLEFLASDAMNGRGSGTRDEQIAAEYVGAQFRRLGFKPGGAGGSYVQTVEIVRPAAAGKPSIAIGPSTKWTYGKEFVVTSLSAPEITGPLQRLSSASTDVQKGAVVFLADENQELAARAALGGAVAVLMRRNMTAAQWEASAARTPTFGTRIIGIPATASSPDDRVAQRGLRGVTRVGRQRNDRPHRDRRR